MAGLSATGALAEGSNWRETTLNHSFGLCGTYPLCLVVPEKTTDEELQEVARFRSKQRLPCLSWRHPTNQAVIVRCAQPLVGLTGKKSPADEKLFLDITQANDQASGIAMMDARPWANAQANKGRGGGFEKVSNYEDSDTTLLFLNIDNIHVMRDSANQMYELIRSAETHGSVSPKELLKTGWPAYIGRVLGAASTIINEVEHNGKSVIVHCSDGWDRTAQLCAVPQLCLDPYYRTMVGFRVLVQREWNSFGHKFRDRTWGHKPHERSPIFLQFIDCVQNMMIKYPCAFEFNEWFLLKIVDALHSMLYSDFRHNNEQDFMKSPDDPALFWGMVAEQDGGGAFKNKAYDPEAQSRIIMPPIHAIPWMAFFNRWTEDPITGRPSKLMCVAPEDMPAVPTPVGAVQTIEGLLLSGFAPPPPPCLVSAPIHFEGWLYQVKSGALMKKENRRLFMMHELVGGEGQLVIYELEKSRSIIPVEIHMFSPKTLSVKMMPKRTASSETGRTYFQIRVSEESALPSVPEFEALLTTATEDSEKPAAPAVVNQIQEAAAIMPSDRAAHLARWLIERLTTDAIPVKLKVLKLIEAMLDRASPILRSTLQELTAGPIAAAATFNTPDPVHGDAPAALIRSTATAVGQKLKDAGAVAAVGAKEQKVTKIVVSAESSEQLDGWVTSINNMSAVASAWTEDASDDEEAGDAMAAGVAKIKGVHASASASLKAATKKFSGKATAAMLDPVHGEDLDDSLPFDLFEKEFKVKAKRTEMINWPVAAGQRIRYKLVCGAHNVGVHAYFVSLDSGTTASPAAKHKAEATLADELAPLLEQVTEDSDAKAPDKSLSSLRTVAGVADPALCVQMAMWLSRRLETNSTAVKLKTLGLLQELLEDGVSNGHMCFSIKLNCLTAVKAAKSFIAMPDPKYGDRPVQMVRQMAESLEGLLLTLPPEPREVLIPVATIPATGVVQMALDIDEAGRVCFEFDNTYSKLRAKEVDIYVGVEPPIAGLNLTKSGSAGWQILRSGAVAGAQELEPMEEEVDEEAVAARLEELLELDEDATVADVVEVLREFKRVKNPPQTMKVTAEALRAGQLPNGMPTEVAAAGGGGGGGGGEGAAAAAAAADEDDDDDMI